MITLTSPQGCAWHVFLGDENEVACVSSPSVPSVGDVIFHEDEGYLRVNRVEWDIRIGYSLQANIFTEKIDE